jgi:ATP-binding cassette, subfamily G (WHITE), member 2, SNQ2
MLLVLGRPGSGCTTFLKAIGNQRAGYESIDGEVTYGGTNEKTMAEKYRSEGANLLVNQFWMPYHFTDFT